MEKRNMVEALNLALRQEMARDKRVMVLGEDVGKEGGVFRVTDGLQKEFGPERVVDTPLAESGIVGTTMGLAIGGMIPVAEIQFSGFLPPALDQIINNVARIRWRSRGRFTCPLVIRVPSARGVPAPRQHPAGPPRPSGGGARGSEAGTPRGSARLLREGEQVTVITWGAMIREAVSAVEQLESERISAELIDVRSFVPFDAGTVVASVEKTGRVVIVHEAPRTSGFAAEIIAQINGRATSSPLPPAV